MVLPVPVAPVTLECGDSLDPSNLGKATATDNCDPDVLVTYTDAQVRITSYNVCYTKLLRIAPMNEFYIIAMAHFIALLSPGVDFIYILKSSTSNRFAIASGASFGIAFS